MNVKYRSNGRLKASVLARQRADKLEMNSSGKPCRLLSGVENRMAFASQWRTPYTSPYIYITQAGDDMREIPTPVASPCRHLQMHRNSTCDGVTENNKRNCALFLVNN